VHGKLAQKVIEDRSADVIPKHVDTIGKGGAHSPAHVVGLVVVGGVEAAQTLAEKVVVQPPAGGIE